MLHCVYFGPEANLWGVLWASAENFGLATGLFKLRLAQVYFLIDFLCTRICARGPFSSSYTLVHYILVSFILGTFPAFP